MSTTDPHSPATRRRAALPVRFTARRSEELKFDNVGRNADEAAIRALLDLQTSRWDGGGPPV
jgi:hypothetical protein